MDSDIHYPISTYYPEQSQKSISFVFCYYFRFLQSRKNHSDGIHFQFCIIDLLKVSKSRVIFISVKIDIFHSSYIFQLSLFVLFYKVYALFI